MWETCCSLAESPNMIASLAVAAVGLSLLSKAVDDWQAQRVSQRNRLRTLRPPR
jgi:hypothetical protein